MKMIGKILMKTSEVFLRYNRKLYSFDTGREVSIHDARKGIVIEFSTTKTFRESGKKISGRYVYRKRNGTYIASSSLTTAFLHEVLKDIYGENVVIEGRKLIVAFLGEKQEVFFIDEEREKEEVLQYFYQGIDYTKVDVGKAVSLLLKKDYRIPVIFAFFILFTLMLFMFFPKEEEEFITESVPVIPERPVSPDLQTVLRTNGFIRAVLKLHERMNVAEFVGDIDFTNHAVRYFSFIPSRGYTKGNPYFEKSEVLDSESNVKSFRTLKECRQILYRFGAEPFFITENFEEYIFSGEADIDRVFSFLKEIYGCPVEIHGTVEFVNLFKRNLNLRIKLFGRL